MKKEFIDIISEADLVLIGIGAEFEKEKYLKDTEAVQALNELAQVLQGKNYFVVTTCTNDIVKDCGLNEECIVCPCGNVKLKQCNNLCDSKLFSLTDEDVIKMQKNISDGLEPGFGTCAECGALMVLNNVYASKYNEEGYLKDWSRYTKWLQGTLNKKLCILELGVNLVFPSIIRWPFEKVGFYNQKATFIRVNETLYHMSEELKDKGISVAQNSIDWLLESDI